MHRDLKPANIFLHRLSSGQMVGKILDFGISKVLGANTSSFALTKTGTVVGSPAYMSPEQAAGREDLDGRADVWSLGVVLYEALTGVLPHEAPNYNALMVRILTHDPDPISKRRPGLPRTVQDLVDSCLQRERDDRPTAATLCARMEAATRELRAERFRRSGGRRRTDVPSQADPFAQDEGLSRKQLAWSIAIGAASGLVTGLLVLMLGYYLLLR